MFDYNKQPSITRLGVLLLLFDVYLTWARIEKQTPLQAATQNNSSSGGYLATQPIGLQYLFFRQLCAIPLPPSRLEF